MALNFAQQDVAKEIVHVLEDFFEKTTDINLAGGGTIPGTELYSLPTDFLKFKRVENTLTAELFPAIDLNEKYGNNGNSIVNLYATAGSFSYYIMGNSIGFTPTPQAVVPVRITYVYRLADLANPSDVSDIPSEHHDMMAVRAAIDMFIKDQEDTSALEGRWNFLLDQMHRTLRQRQVQDPKHVRRSETSWGSLN